MFLGIFSATQTWAPVVLVLRVTIEETGISQMELCCHSLEVVISFRIVMLRELIYIDTMVQIHQLVSISVMFQLMLSMIIVTSL